MKKVVSIIIPSFNEERNVIVIAEQLQQLFSELPYAYEIIFVDDGSSDNTLENIRQLSKESSNIFFIELSRNFGHQYALKAGIDNSSGDCAISLDADLQHPVRLIPALLEKWEDGYDIVYTRRVEDKSLGFFKNRTSRFFYKMLNSISDVKFEDGIADFRLMDRKVCNVFSSLKESNLFIRGIVVWLGFKQIGIDYFPDKRLFGQSKYSLKKMFNLALSGIVSFSIRPLYLAIYLGFIMSAASLAYVPYVFYSLYTRHYVSGWASVLMTIVFFGGLQLIVLGIIGIYIGKLFMQVKERPHYIIRDTNLKIGNVL